MSGEAGRPEAFVQWKNTDACLDLYCACGEQFHFDGYFAYELTCGHCGQTYELPNTLRIHPVEPSRRMVIIFDEGWAPAGGVIRDGEFAVPWPLPAFAGAEPGDPLEVQEGIPGGVTQRARVKLIRVEAAGDGTMRLIVANCGIRM
jgi:hypothetical protein